MGLGRRDFGWKMRGGRKWWEEKEVVVVGLSSICVGPHGHFPFNDNKVL